VCKDAVKTYERHLRRDSVGDDAPRVALRSAWALRTSLIFVEINKESKGLEKLEFEDKS
jgi:hypothetical protein